MTPFLRFRAGEHQAFDEVVSAYMGSAYAASLQILGDPALAEEAVQEALLRVWERAAQFDPERGNEKSWIMSIVRNQAIDLHRKRVRQAERSIEDTPSVYQVHDANDVWKSVESSLTGEAVVEALRGLPGEQRDVLVLAYYRGLRPVEIARQSGVPEGTVRSRLRLGLQRLQASLAPLREADR